MKRWLRAISTPQRRRCAIISRLGRLRSRPTLHDNSPKQTPASGAGRTSGAGHRDSERDAMLHFEAILGDIPYLLLGIPLTLAITFVAFAMGTLAALPIAV